MTRVEKIAVKHTTFLLFLLGVFAFGSLAAQTAGNSITSTDSTGQDSLKTIQKPRSSDIDGPIRYWAEMIEFLIPEQKSRLRGKVKIVYEEVTLTAGKVLIDWQNNSLVAEGVADSTDSLGHPVLRDLPVLVEKGDAPIRGRRLEFNFKTRRGKVLEGRTDMEPGYYRGEDVRKIGEETLLIEDGYFTSCDLEEHPHFYFRTAKMRMRVKKTAVARPVVLYIADVPVMAAPFAVFSLKRGRRSGIILPTYGESSFGGRYLQDFGYYWAPSDYWDATLLATFYERTGLNYSGKMEYRKRYALNGRVSGSYSPKDITTGNKVERWQLAFNHSQQIGQTLSISGQGTFVSDKNYNRDYFTNFDQRTNQTLRTTVNIQKRLPGSRSLSVNMQRFQNLQTEKIDYTLPDVSFTQPSKSIFPKKSGARTRWFNNIRYSYNSRLIAEGSNNPVADDSTGEVIGFQPTRNGGWQHSLTPTFSAKLFKHFNVTPSVSFQELWAPQYLEYGLIDSTNTVAIVDTVSEFRARHTFSSVGVGINTNLYGLWEVPFVPLKIIRHRMTPSIGVSYRPDFSDERYGYYQTVIDTAGNEIKRDRFAGNPLGGSPGIGIQRNINFSLKNQFQGKWIRNGEEKKLDLFRADFSTSYNAAADSLKLRNLTTVLQAKPHQKVNIVVNATHSFYKLKADGLSRINRFVWDDGFALPNLLDWSARINFGWSLQPRRKKNDKPDPAVTDSTADFPSDLDYNDTTERNPEFDRFEGFNNPWSVDMNFSYSYNDDGRFIRKRLDGSVSGRIQLTKNWKVNYRASINVLNRELNNQNFTIQRDLHCWEMNFTWSPNPRFSYYRLELRVRESALRDLKLTKTAGNSIF